MQNKSLVNHFKDKFYSAGKARYLQGLVLSTVLSACGKEKEATVTPEKVTDTSPVPTVPVPPTLTESTNYVSHGINDEALSTTYDILKTIEEIKDSNTTDSDKLDITTADIVGKTPLISGFEFINFYLSESIPINAAIVNIENISDFKTVSFTNLSTETTIPKISVLNATGAMEFNGKFDTIDVHSVANANIEIETSLDADIKIRNDANSLKIDGGGKFVTVDTSNLGFIDITNTSGINLVASKAKDGINLVSNGDVTLTKANLVEGNVTISAIGDIDLIDISSANGKLDLENLRADQGSDIVIKNASRVKSAEIKSAGSVEAILNGGLNSAEEIHIVAAENSNIHALSNVAKSVSLNAINSSNSEVIFDINIKGMDSLAFGGNAPILLKSLGDNLNETVVTSSNSSDVKISMTSANTDLSNVSSNVEIQLPNLDGKKITVGNNQNLAIDAEFAQTAFLGVTEYQFSSPASSSSSNTIKISTIDTNPTNSDNVANIAGLKLSDVQKLDIDLTSSVSLDTSQDIIGTDLKTVTLYGSGDFSLGNNTIVGAPDGTVSLNSSNYSGKLTISVDDTIYGVKSVTSGSGDDNITIDGVSSSLSSAGRGISINSGSGQDKINFTANADGRDAKILINGGEGIDKLSFAAGTDFSLSDLTITEIEILEFTGGPSSVKLPSTTVSERNISIEENGTGNLTLDIFPTAQKIDLSSLVFDSSIVSGTDKIVIDGSNFSKALSITGSSMDDLITGTYTSNDTIISGDGNDTINGRDGNDILTPGDGVDHITPSLGNDTVNLSELVAASDTLYFSFDDGASNVDIISNFDVRIVDDIISLDVSATSTPITNGNASAATAAAKGTIRFHEQGVDQNANDASRSIAQIIKLTQTDQGNFADALGTGEVTVANGAVLCFLWYDTDVDQAVFGYSDERTSGDSDNKITKADTFVEIVRLNMTDSAYTHFLDADNFVFI